MAYDAARHNVVLFGGSEPAKGRGAPVALAFFDACVATDVRQIVLLDGPSVRGWDAWHEIEGRYHFSTMRDGLKALMKAGYLEPRPPEPLAHLLFGALNEAARVLAHAPDPKPVRRELMDAHIRLMEGLRPMDRRQGPT
ncbi:hypothetical protein EPN29_07590 [bacterium]|nr:MAG: hypothetical protein EPN29_07590 [bacterium]